MPSKTTLLLRFAITGLLLVGTGCDAAGGQSEVSEETQGNRPPVFVSSAPTAADHNRLYAYAPLAEDPDGDPVTLAASGLPSWLSFDAANGTITGTSGWTNRGNVGFRITASDGELQAVQQVSLTVQAGDPDCTQEFGDPAASLYTLPWQEGGQYRVIQSYCPSNSAWGHHKWLAYDFDMAIGDTVLASRDGTVLSIQEHNPDGTRECGVNRENFVNIEHDDGTVMRYVHLTTDGALVAAGEAVVQGQAIGLSGDSGCSSGPHLHVTLHHDRTHYGRQSTLPLNYRNAEGPLDARKGLYQATSYTALPR